MLWSMVAMALAGGPEVGDTFPTHEAISLDGHPYTVIELTRSVDW